MKLLMTCKQACEAASAHHDHELGVTERLALRFHLLICRYCRAFYRNFAIIVSAIPALLPKHVTTNLEVDEAIRRLGID